MVVHVLICSLDYKGTSCPLTCTYDGNNMQAMLKACDNVGEVRVLYDNEATKVNAEAAMRELAGRCDPATDYFLFYYSGHGASVPDKDGDEADGKDEALCFVGPNGELNSGYFMTDDHFAEIITSAFKPGTKILIITDCCHSGTVGDLSKPCWADFDVISMTGCMDAQTSGDIGTGGIFTHSMLLAMDKFENAGRADYSVAELYKATLKEDETVFSSKQDITMKASSRARADQMKWPLLPRDWEAPFNGALGAVGAQSADLSSPGGMQQIMQALLSNPAVLQQFNISPSLVQLVAKGAEGLLASYACKHLGVKESTAMGVIGQVKKFLLGRCLKGAA